MKIARACLSTVAVACVVALAGCGGSEDQSQEASAEVKTQVNQVCREVATELKGLPMPVDQAGAVKVQTDSAEIFETASGKLNELSRNTELPSDYKSWIDELGQLAQYNRQAAAAFAKNGVTSDQAMNAGEKWEGQEKKVNDLARKAGLDNCVVGKSKSA